MEDSLIIILAAVAINLIITHMIIRSAVKQAISEPTFRDQSLMRMQFKQTLLLAEIAKKMGVDEATIDQIVMDQEPK